MDIAYCHLEGNADAAEFCAHPPFHRLLAAATYTLQQDEGAQPTRSGSISLFSATTSELELLHRVPSAGVFDIKWNPSNAGGGPLLAQAGADGFLTLYSLNNPGFSLSQVCTEKVSTSMCLCVDWNLSGNSTSLGLSDGWVSTLAIHEDQLRIIQSWEAHEYEIWAAVFDAHQVQLLYTGSDDCCFSGWDLRQTCSSSLPVFRNAKSHTMGVCCIAKCSSDSNMLLTGSYDELLRVWDVRSMSRPVLVNSVNLGGGVWRLKHHPCNGGLVLAACMHNGFAIVKIDGENISILETYNKHESLAYGADWQRGGECMENENGRGSLVATCSFYDRLLRIWQPQCLQGR